MNPETIQLISMLVNIGLKAMEFVNGIVNEDQIPSDEQLQQLADQTTDAQARAEAILGPDPRVALSSSPPPVPMNPPEQLPGTNMVNP